MLDPLDIFGVGSIRMPAVVDEAAYFAVSGDEPVCFDLRATTSLSEMGVHGLYAAARLAPVELLVNFDSQPCRTIRRVFGYGPLVSLGMVAPGCWRQCLDLRPGRTA